MPRPSGLPLIEDSENVLVEVSHIDGRGRFSLLPRWRKRIRWLASAGDADVEALMIFVEPGRISIRDSKIDGPRIRERYAEIANSSAHDRLELLRLIQDRYRCLIVPPKERPSLGDGALAHLGLRVERGEKSIVYVSVLPETIELLSPSYRDSKLTAGDPRIDDLP
jgi:hypothetical protein